jgi:hypothetical protein
MLDIQRPGYFSGSLIGQIISYFSPTTPNSNGHHQQPEHINGVPRVLLIELKDIAGIRWADQRPHRLDLINNYEIIHGETNLINLFSIIYSDERFEKPSRDQAVLCLNALLGEKPTKELQGLVTNFDEVHPFARRWGVIELRERNSSTSNLAYLYIVIVTSDHPEVRKAAVEGLGETGNSACLDPLRNISPHDPIYNEAQEAIRQIQTRTGQITRLRERD